MSSALASLVLVGLTSDVARVQAGEARVPPRDSKLPRYELKMAPKDLVALERDPRSDETYPATFLAGGKTYEGVRVRYRGEWARSWPKKPLKIFFRPEQPFEGHRSLNLNSAWRDPALVREPLAYHIYATCGVAASRSRMVRLDVNGDFHGVYVEVEQVDKTFLRRHQLKGAALFKTTSHNNQADERDRSSLRSLAGHYENEIEETNDVRQLQRFCHDLAMATNVLEFFTERVVLERYVNYLAVNVLVQNWDCFSKNHFLVQDVRGSGKWLVLPWDLDRTLGDDWHNSFNRATLPVLLGTRLQPGITGWNRLQERFFTEPALRRRFLDRLAELVEKEFTTEKLFPLVDRFEAELGPDAALDEKRWPGPGGDLRSGLAELKRFIEQRRLFVQREIKRLRSVDP